MATMQTARAQLFIEIEHLSGRYLAELESFVQFLKFKQEGAAMPDDSRCRVLAPEDDPLLQAVGAVDAVPFAETLPE